MDGRGKESAIVTYCRPEEQKALLTSLSNNGEPHENMESIIDGLVRPDLGDSHPFQHPNTITLFDCKLTK